MNGYQMRGVIHAFDPYVVVLMTDNKQQVIYKHCYFHHRSHSPRLAAGGALLAPSEPSEASQHSTKEEP